ncbi:unnamed protein product [Clonostachys rhizophaga]|uniref:Major facilitator superfamily (MFS) profile domain-containing protein n=1 Tax=Clonostachys rhizophaga TaxID=160324 RepID=A0A9N9VC05_9HYPO|nr:unnamed protein product [Clonostachys rhizophaga]
MAQATNVRDDGLPRFEESKETSYTSSVEVASSIDDGQADRPSKNLAGWKLALVVLGLCLAIFCMALDNTIIATAIPRITDDFRALDDLGSFQLLFGKLYSIYPVKWVFLAAIGFFEIGSLVCGVAPASTTLIIGRAIAGLGSAGIFSGAILMIVLSVPMQQRPTYIGILAGMYGISSVAGPLIRGAFTDRLTWRWCFYINLPFGAITVLFVVLFFKPPQAGMSSTKKTLSWKQHAAQFDLEGTVCFLPAIISLLLALQWGGSRYDWSNGRVIGLFVTFGVLIIMFVGVQFWKKDRATVPPRVFSDRLVWSCAAFAVFFGALFFPLVYYGANAVRSGIMNLPMIIGLVVMSILAGLAVSAFGYYTPFIYTASVLMSIGAGLLTTFHTNTKSPSWIGYQALYGLGAGLGMQLPLVAVQTALPEPDIPNVFTNRLGVELEAAGVDPAIASGVGATELRDKVPLESLGLVLVAYSKALMGTWYVSVAMAVLSLVAAVAILWKSVKAKKVNVSNA